MTLIVIWVLLFIPANWIGNYFRALTMEKRGMDIKWSEGDLDKEDDAQCFVFVFVLVVLILRAIWG